MEHEAGGPAGSGRGKVGLPRLPQSAGPRPGSPWQPRARRGKERCQRAVPAGFGGASFLSGVAPALSPRTPVPAPPQVGGPCMIGLLGDPRLLQDQSQGTLLLQLVPCDLLESKNFVLLTAPSLAG